MSVLVTGAAGFLGTETVAQLRAAGHEVITTDKRGEVDHLGNLADADFVRTLPDVGTVIHAAAVQYVSSDLPKLIRARYFATNNIAATTELARRYATSVDYFLLVGTSMMYDQTKLPIYTTASPLRGQGVYSRSKLASFEVASRTLKVPFGTMIPCIIGGPGREGLFRGFVQTMVGQGFAVRPGPGTYLTSMVHVKDAAALLVQMTDAQATGLHNAAAPTPLSINSWIEIIADELSLPAPRLMKFPYWLLQAGAAATRYRILAREQLLMLGQDHVLSTEESQALGWAPEYTNERIVRDIAGYVRSTMR